MVSRPETKKARIKRHKRIRSKISGTAQCPRLCVFRSTNNIYAQLIDDVAGVTLAQASSLDKSIEGNGGNKEAARLAGINVNKLTVLVYSFAGFAASIAAIIMVARTNASQPGAGSSYAFDCMTAACLGGVSIAGGEGKISGTVVGVIILGILDNGLVLMGVNSNFQSVIKGLILLLAVAIDCYQGGQKRKKA